MLRGKFWKAFKAPLEVNSSCALKSLRTFQKAQPGASLLDVCDWLFIVVSRCPAAALSFYAVLCSGAAPLSSLSHRCCTSGNCYSSSFSSSPQAPCSCISTQQPNICMVFLITEVWRRSSAHLLPRPVTKEGLGWQGTAGLVHSHPSWKADYFCTAAWVGKKEEEEPCTAISVANVVPNKSSEEMNKQNLCLKETIQE